MIYHQVAPEYNNKIMNYLFIFEININALNLKLQECFNTPFSNS